MAGATEQAKDAVQQAGEQVRTRLRELESMQQEIERLKQAPVSVSEDATNQLRIQQLEREVLQVQQEINVHLEIAEHEVKEVLGLGLVVAMIHFELGFDLSSSLLFLQAVLQAQASFNPQEANQYTTADGQVNLDALSSSASARCVGFQQSRFWQRLPQFALQTLSPKLHLYMLKLCTET